MEYNDYINELNKIYNKYYSNKQYCIYYNACKQNIQYKNAKCILEKYLFDRAKVGEKYGENSIPHIVMVGIEGISNDPVVKQYSKPSLDAINPHYNGVKYVVSYLLADFLNEKKPFIVTNSGVDWVQKALERYTLCNLYRCAFIPDNEPARKKGLQHSYEMQKNCIELLIEEITSLAPDIVVFQISDTGIFTTEMRNYVNKCFDIEWEDRDNYHLNIGNGKINNRKAIFINTLHGAYGGFKNHKYLEELNIILDKAIATYRSSRDD